MRRIRIAIITILAALIGLLVAISIASAGHNSNGLVGYWNGDADGIDLSGHGNGGTLVNGATSVLGKIGQAFSFDGNNDGVQIADSADFDITDFTVAAWIKTTNAGNSRRWLISQYQPPDNFWGMTLLNNQLEVCSRTSDGVFDFSGSCVAYNGQTLNDGQFHHVAITREAGVEVKWYIDGVNVKTQAIANASSFALNAEVFIGKLDPVTEAHFNTNESYNGLIDEARIYNRALSGSEIKHQANGLVGYWAAESNADDSADGNHGTLKGGAGFAPGKVGQAFSSLGDQTKYVVIPHLATIDLQNSSHTVANWIYADSLPAGPGFIFTPVTAQKPGGFGGLWRVNNGNLRAHVWVNDTDVRLIDFPYVFPEDEWVHVAQVYDSATSTLSVYVNGQSIGSGSGSVVLYARGVDNPVIIGKAFTENENREEFSASYDEVKIYNRALTGPEILALARTTFMVSVASDGTAGNAGSLNPKTSADGRYAAFYSGADNLVADDTNGRSDVFVRDRVAGETTTRVSVAADGTEGNRSSYVPDISADGRYVVFLSDATTLGPTDDNGSGDIYMHDRDTGEITLVSVNGNGEQGNFGGTLPAISADGRHVTFNSFSTNLDVKKTTTTFSDIFVRDLGAATTSLVSVNASGNAGGAGSSQSASISADGRYIAFESTANDLVPGDSGLTDVFVRDLVAGTTTRVSVSSGGDEGNGTSNGASISADGRYVAFNSTASNLVAGDSNARTDIFVHDRDNSETTRVSVASDGVQGNFNSSSPDISADGRYVVFDSTATNLVSDDTNFKQDVFVHDRLSGITTRVSVDSQGGQGDGNSRTPAISDNGVTVAFLSTATIVPEKTDVSFNDSFVRDWQDTTPPVDVDLDGFAPPADCNDNDFAINPDAIEVADGVDNNCDGQIDEVVDTDGDGIADDVDVQPSVPSFDFSDGLTTGTVLSGSPTITDSDQPPPDDGVRIAAGGVPATVSANVGLLGGSVQLNLDLNDEIIVTAGSAVLVVLTGPIIANLFGENGLVGTVELDAGQGLTFDPSTNSVTAGFPNNGDDIVVLVGTNQNIIAPGQPVILEAAPGSTTITLITGNNPVGSLDPLITFSLVDEFGGATFPSTDQARIISPNGAWSGPISGTKYVNCAFSDSDDCGENKTLRYRQSFTLPLGFTAPSLRIDVHADNDATVYLNGTQIGTGTDFTGPPATFYTTNGSLFQAGSNNLDVDLIDFGGAQGLDYNATVSYIPLPLLTVTKVIDDGDVGSLTVSDFPLFVDLVSVTSGVQNPFSAGAHTVSETGDPRYDETIGGDCAANGSINLVLGQIAECTITNADLTPPVVTVALVLVPGDDDDDEAKFTAEFSCDDLIDPTPTFVGIMVTPSLDGLTQVFITDSDEEVEFDLTNLTVTIKAPDTATQQALLAQLQSGGIVVTPGQLIELEIDDDVVQKVEFDIERDGRLEIEAPSAAFFMLRVTCEDAAGNEVEVGATPTFPPTRSPVEAVDSLIAFINALPPGDEAFKGSLIDDLLAVKAALAFGGNEAAVDLLNLFIDRLDAEAGIKLTNDDAEILIGAAEEIIESIGDGAWEDGEDEDDDEDEDNDDDD